MIQNQPSNDQKLKPYFTRLGTWAFSIGTSIGWGSFVITCTTYLFQAGVLGTIFGLIVGMIVILIINHNLCYMMERCQDAGGIYTFAGKVRSHDTGFLVAWFLLLTYLAVLWANITSLPLFASRFFGNFFQFGFSYEIFGSRVYFGEVLLSVAAICLIGLLCAKTRKIPHLIVIVLAIVFVAGVAICTVIALIGHGSGGYSYDPSYIPDKAAWEQILRVAVISPWAFIGFENAAHFSEEFTFPVKKVRGVMLFSVIFTTLFYIMMSLLSVSAYPAEYSSWLSYIRDMNNLEGIKAIPAFYAAEHYLGSAGITILVLALFGVIITSMIGNLTALSRLLHAFGRKHHWAGGLHLLNKHHIPGRAIFVIVFLSCLIPFLGRTTIGWIVDVTTLGTVLIYAFLSDSVFKDAFGQKNTKECITGILGTAIMIGAAVLLLAPKLIGYEALASESYLLFASWALLGIIFFRIVLQKDGFQFGHSVVVWVVLLLLMLLTALMWMNGETQAVTNASISDTRSYLNSFLTNNNITINDFFVFLTNQMAKIENTSIRNTFVSFALFLVAVLIMINNYRVSYKKEQEWKDRFGAAREVSLTDSLTGIKNKYAYTQWEEGIDEEIRGGNCLPFSIVVCDINDLKVINDTLGHLAGDECIRKACRVICKVFSHSPVFRYGGDEFVVILRGPDFLHREALMEQINSYSEAPTDPDHVVIAAGIADYNKDQHKSLLKVFEEADQNMYNRKQQLKKAKRQKADADGTGN